MRPRWRNQAGFALLAALVATSLVACGGDDSGSESSSSSGAATTAGGASEILGGAATVELPKGWKVLSEEAPEGAPGQPVAERYVIIGLESNPVIRVAAAGQADPPANLEQRARTNYDSQKGQEGKGLITAVGPLEQSELGGAPAFTFGSSINLQGTSSSSLTLETERESDGTNFGYTITYTAPASDFKRHDQDYEAILNSWRWAG